MKNINIILSLIITIILSGCGDGRNSDRKITQTERHRLRLEAIQENDGILHFEYDSIGRLSSLKFTESDKVVTDSVNISYEADTVAMLGIINGESLSQRYILNRNGNAMKCHTIVDGGIENEDLVETSFLYDASGYLIESSSILKDRNRRETEQNFSFTIKNGNIGEIYNSLTKTNVVIDYSSQANVSEVYTIPNLWDSRAFVPAIYAGILGHLSMHMPKSAHVDCSFDSTVVDYTFNEYLFTPDGEITGWSESVKSKENTDTLNYSIVFESY